MGMTWLLSLLMVFTFPIQSMGGGILSAIEAKYSKVEAIKGSFEEIHYPGGSTWKGRFIMERGGKILWDYTDPPGKRIVSDGRTIYYIVEREKKVYLRRIKNRPSTLFLVWSKDKEKRFRIAVDEGPEIKVTLIPKREGEGFRMARLSFRKKDLRLLSITIKDEIGNTTVVVFKNWKEVKPPPDATFTVKAPKGFKKEELK